MPQYCSFIDNCLKVLQWSPIIVATPMLFGHHPEEIPNAQET